MAQIPQPKAGNSLFELPDELPPRGTHIAKCINIKDCFGVERKKFQSEEMEKCDITAFLFGFRTKDGKPHQIASRTMKISGSEKSSLHSFLKSWLGQAPRLGWDYMELKGRTALITVDHQPSRTKPGAMYAVIASISPLPDGYVQSPVTTQPVAPPPVPVHTPPPVQPVAAAPSVEDAGDDALPF